jgi:hypothetical protein
MVGHASEVDRGDPALLRNVFRGRVGSAWPVIVVEDSDERVALYLRAGTPIRWLEGELPLWLDSADRAALVRQWERTNVLLLMTPGRAHSVWVMWSADTGAFLCWMVNMQEPITRTRFGWDTWDQELDIVVSADLRWAWKDEDKFARLVELGPFNKAIGEQIRAEGRAVIADIEARRPPFNEPWPAWQPDPSWPIPMLPPDWDSP